MLSWRRSPGGGALDQEKRQPAFHSLLDSARSGESEALSLLYRQFLPGVFGYIAARVPDRFTAEDLTSEVFLDMVEGINKVRAKDEAAFAAWLFQIARIAVAGYYRKHEHVPVSVSLESTFWKTEGDIGVLPENHPVDDPARWAEAREEWNVVVESINELTEEQRQVLVGRLLLGYDVATVARMIGKKANAVKALQFRALNSLQRLLRQKNLSQEMFQRSVRHQEEAL